MKHLLAPLFLLAVLLAPLVGQAAACDDPHRLRFALSPIKNPERQQEQYRPLVRLLEKSLGRPVEIVPTPSYGAAIEGLLSNDIDLAEIGPASYAIAVNRGAHLTPFATFAMKDGHGEAAATYRSLLVVRRDRGIADIAGLKGRTLGLTDPASTSGAILPHQAIVKLTGRPAAAYFKRVVFAGSHDRAIDNVRLGQVDAAFVSSSRLDEALRQGRVKPDELQVLWRSAPIPYDPFVLRQHLCPALTKKIRAVFLGRHDSLAGMFAELGVAGFAPTSDAAYRDIRELFAEPR